MTKIISLSGKKGSGKGESCKFLEQYIGSRVGFLVGAATCKTFSFATPLKRFCVDVMGLKKEQMYGTEQQKNSLTRYKWEDMPHVITDQGLDLYGDLQDMESGFCHPYPDLVKLKWHPPGFMTAREILQEVGTGIFRRMYGPIWAEALIREIEAWDGQYAFVDDMRFPDEFEAVEQKGGKCVRLTRNVNGPDEHPSERMLDADKFNHSRFHLILDNQKLTIDEQNLELAKFVRSLKW